MIRTIHMFAKNFKAVKKFKYLGITFATDDKSSKELNILIWKASAVTSRFDKI